ncbi:MAG: nucleotidyltransferase domain-containing protein [Methylococcales symbiont of Iophon sp. n. MRB-2018]|nr:MAG: nucleotidyltransferase domain-containing protein [Methylococcales symbiont of Iophon sp. n. MRB-2018]KAF3980522.1 MAG: nucleotidyltransferase domain-containing protein [Methylococcales symbiont of Iophon sp. n. MRB-2018]
MRLSNAYQKAIVNITQQYFDKGAEVYLFGSRVDDDKKGGDIDLYIIPEHTSSARELYERKIKFLVALQLAIGEQQVDVILAKDRNRPIEKEAIRTGVKL